MQIQRQRGGWRWGWAAIAVTLAGMLVACSSGSSTSVSGTPTPLPRGQWIRPIFPGITTPTVSSVAFADANQQRGYACTATLAASSTGTPTATGTPVATTTPAPTGTVGIPGHPTEPVQPQNISNGFWRTLDGGQTWQAVTLPTTTSNLLCPLSAIVAPDLADPDDVFVLAAIGALNLSNPTSITPGQVRFELWRSLDAGTTWQSLTVPTVPSPVATGILSPYHLFVAVDGAALALGTNYSGQNELFTSTDAGKTWQIVPPINSVASQPKTSARPFLGFAGGPNGTIFALTDNSSFPSEKPVALWQSNDNAQTWKRLSDVPATLAAGATQTGQIYTTGTGQTIYAFIHATAATGVAAGSVKVARSTDAGVTWTPITWPSSAATPAAPLGGALIAQLGIDFAVDSRGDAFAAPTLNDLSAQQDPNGQQSAGFYAVLAGQTAFQLVGQPAAVQETAFDLAVSLTPSAALAPPSGAATPPATATVATTPSATTTPAPASTVTIEPTATPGAGGAPTPAPTTAPPTIDGLPTLWSNFGPITQFTTAPDTAGLLENILP